MTGDYAPTPRRLLLRLLTVAEGRTLDAAAAVRACALFGITANSARVTLTRLLSAGLVEMVERGTYRLGRSGQALGRDVLTWRDAEVRVCEWTGGWVAAATSGLPRTPRSLLQTRERALALVGMRQLEKDLFVRPDNLVGGVAQVRERLHALGLEETAPVFLATHFDPSVEGKAVRLWDGHDLEKQYHKAQKELDASMARIASLPIEDAARESYLIGDAVLRVLVFDPLLPEPLVSTTTRRRLSETMRRYEEVGQQVWQSFLFN